LSLLKTTDPLDIIKHFCNSDQSASENAPNYLYSSLLPN
jgi:hypothetical protein